MHLKDSNIMRHTTNLFASQVFCDPFVFMALQIAFPVNSLFLERSALPPGCALCVRNPVFRFLPGSMFSAACGLFCALGARFAHACLCFQPVTDSFAKYPGGGGGQRGRGRNGGRAVSGRGRMRKRGPSGGGTLRSELPQQGQRPSSQNARVASARSQWPLASHCGLMHWTVKPGRNCISFSPQRPARFCAAGRVARDPNSLTDGCWRGFWRSRALLSREKTTICWGTVAGVRWHIRCLWRREKQNATVRSR